MCNNCNCSPCTCSCTEQVNPCSTTSGCLSTNYSKCIYYSGTDLSCIGVDNGATLDTILEAMDTKICELTGVDLAGFNYACVDDVVGGPFTTLQDVLEGYATFMCTHLYKPSFTKCASFNGSTFPSVTPGTTTLAANLTAIHSAICTLETMIGDGVPAPADITYYCLTAPTGITTFEGYIEWLAENICNIDGAIDTRLDALESFQTSITNLFNATFTDFDNTDCTLLSNSGGGVSDDIRTTIAVIKTAVCDLQDQVSAIVYPSGNVSVTWGCSYGYTTSDTIANHFAHVVAELKKVKFIFDPTYFTTTVSACSTTISLNALVDLHSDDYSILVTPGVGANEFDLSLVLNDSSTVTPTSYASTTPTATAPVKLDITSQGVGSPGEWDFEVQYADYLEIDSDAYDYSTATSPVAQDSTNPLFTAPTLDYTKFGNRVFLDGVIEVVDPSVGAGAWNAIGAGSSIVIGKLAVGFRPSETKRLPVSVFCKIASTDPGGTPVANISAYISIDTVGTIRLLNPYVVEDVSAPFQIVSTGAGTGNFYVMMSGVSFAI